jgi:hypothetical protein
MNYYIVNLIGGLVIGIFLGATLMSLGPDVEQQMDRTALQVCVKERDEARHMADAHYSDYLIASVQLGYCQNALDTCQTTFWKHL